MSGYVPEVRVSGEVYIRLDNGNDLIVKLGHQHAIDVVSLSDGDADFLEDLLWMLAEHAKRTRKRRGGQQ